MTTPTRKELLTLIANLAVTIWGEPDSRGTFRQFVGPIMLFGDPLNLVGHVNDVLIDEDDYREHFSQQMGKEIEGDSS